MWFKVNRKNRQKADNELHKHMYEWLWNGTGAPKSWIWDLVFEQVSSPADKHHEY